MKKIRKIVSVILAAAIAVLLVCSGAGSVSAQAAGRTVHIDACLIQGDTVICQLSGNAAGSDGMLYIFSDEVWQDGPVGNIVASVPAGSTSAVFPLGYNTAGSNLSKKFLVAVKQGGSFVQVSDEHYITNPEAMAAYSMPRRATGIKGILMDPTKISSGELQELGIQQVVYNMYVDQICSGPEVPGAIPFPYNEKMYYFDPGIVGHYDAMVMTLNNMGISVTMVLLNEGTGIHSADLVHPLAKDGFRAPGYALNVANAAGTDHLKAIGAFLGQRYNGATGHGQIDNWILGNEINARTSWWYMGSANLTLNVSEYTKAFRILYNEIKAYTATVNIYNSIDQEWGRKSNPGSFLAREYLDEFNRFILREGNIDWGLSFHPYNSPLYDPYAWNGPAVWVRNDLSTPYITMQNLDLLIAYMHQPQYLNPAGQCRSISLAEIGYTSSFGTESQEASVAYGYLMAASCPDVDAFMLFRQSDSAEEMQSNLALGLNDVYGNHKPAYAIYRDLGTPNQGAAIARASQIIGTDILAMVLNRVIWTRGGDGVVH